MNDDFEKELNYILGYIHADVTQIKEDITEMKAGFIPDGKQRIENLEKDSQSLKTWRNTLVTISTGVTATVAYLVHETINLWGKLNG